MPSSDPYATYATWQLTPDLEQFLGRAGEFLHSDPVTHTVLLSACETLRTHGLHVYGGDEPHFGIRAGGDGVVEGVFVWTPAHRLALSPLADKAAADDLAALLSDAGEKLPGVGAERDTAEAFARAWERHAGVSAEVAFHDRLYRLGTLTPPGPAPQGTARVAVEADRELLMRWHQEFGEAMGEPRSMGSGTWADTRIAYGGITLWETPDGTPVAMSGRTRLVAGQVRVAPVYTPAAHRGRGYAGAATVEVCRAALAEGADEVLLFADTANPTSTGLYQRIGFRPVRDFAQYSFSFTP
ncbi:N-acetyltransferase [Streptomyces longisporoflavus]|uniref:GNAT family N-acetyltransferase n=1 Tax=Streptomyces longisporoflavus TaxID=28044 RepID=UPI00167C6EE0|nr:GNAT family N-acetyltransferase [Streptomyces longisporoflavus]GGV54479.1 N-acetyltransferase [Streptomyces longisporoflavus]